MNILVTDSMCQIASTYTIFPYCDSSIAELIFCSGEKPTTIGAKSFSVDTIPRCFCMFGSHYFVALIALTTLGAIFSALRPTT